MDVLEFFNSMRWGYATLLLIEIFIVFTIAGILLTRRFVSTQILKKHHDVAAVVFANLGVLYGVLLGFTVVNVQQRFDKIEEITQKEAGSLIELYRDAQVFPKDKEREIQKVILTYIDDVLRREWKLMEKRAIVYERSKAELAIWQVYYRLNPTTAKEKVWYRESISKLNQFNSHRLARLVGSRDSLGAEMWTLLILGACSLITFIWFFGLESVTLHILMASILTASTVFLLFLIYSLDTVFTGGVSVPPEAFIKALHTLQNT